MKIPSDQIHKCNMGMGEKCCRYLAMGAGGFLCLKHTELRGTIDAKVAAGEMGAQGDNCEGFAGEKPGSN